MSLTAEEFDEMCTESEPPVKFLKAHRKLFLEALEALQQGVNST